MFETYLDWSLFGNTGADYAIAALSFVLTTAAFWFFKKIILSVLKRLAKRTKSRYDDMLLDFIAQIKSPFYLIISLYVAATFLTLPQVLSKGTEYAVALAVLYYAIKGVQAVIHQIKMHITEGRKREDKDEDTGFLDTIEAIVNIAIWILAALFLLANFGFDVSALLAGLGIGGIAIAIASQAVLSDVFAAFSIYFDKPFKVGDFIIIGEDMGVVKKIGIKTTRIQSLQGQELIISNTELVSSRINNYKRMEKRRIQFGFGVVYDTTPSKLRKIPQMMEKIMSSIKDCKMDRAHFKSFGPSSLDFEVVYYLDSSDYNRYMDVQQEINLKITEAFEKEKIEFAYPTQTLYVKK